MVIWNYINDWTQVPKNALISFCNNPDELVPSIYWYLENGKAKTFCRFVSFNPVNNEFDYEVTEISLLEGHSTTFNTMETESISSFNNTNSDYMYGIEVEPYDPNQEPEDDCL